MTENLTVEFLADQVRSGACRCEDLVQESLNRIAASDSTIRAFVTVCADQALERARQIDQSPVAEKNSMALCGIPIAVKDNICTAGMPTTCSSRILGSFEPPYNATVVEALHRAGAVIVGKTNLDEFAMGSSTENSANGATRNPCDTSCIPGGSSGGSAAAVAAGFVRLALGSDTGGSIRQPSSHCGVVGLKPTYGRVSRYGLVAFGSSLDQIGPMTADVRDAAHLLEVIATVDQRDSTCAGRTFRNDPALYSGDIRGLRLGVPAEYFGEGLSDPVRHAVESTIDNLSRAGAVCVPVSLSSVQYAIATYYIICTAEASSNLARYDGVKYGLRAEGVRDLAGMYCATRSQGFGDEVKRRIMLGTYVLSSGYYDAYYLKAARVRTLIARDFTAAFERCDALVSPVTPTSAFRLGEKCADPLQMYLTDIYTVSANLAGIPAISVPCGLDGVLPVGVQFMAPAWREDTLIRLGWAVQQNRAG